LLGEASIAEHGKTALKLSCRREWVYYPETFEPLALVHRNIESQAQDVKPLPSELYLYNNDPNGCPTRMLDTSGQVMWVAEFNAWGSVEHLAINRTANPLRLQGQYQDQETKSQLQSL
jgi:RHS protein